MYFFKHLELPLWYMIDDREGGIMITLTKDVNSVAINQSWNLKQMQSMLTTFLLDNQSKPIYEDITEADFYYTYNQVQSLMETNYNLFEQKHFNH